MKSDRKTLDTEDKPSFGKLRNFFWPIHAYEHKKLIPLFGLFLFIPFIYHLLRCMKVALVVGGKAKVGAAVIPFLKVWGVLPSAVIFTCLFTALANRFNRNQLFYIVVSFFLGFFMLFTLVLHPNQASLTLEILPSYLSKHLPGGFEGLIEAIQYWPSSLFYILSELWGSVIIAMLLWGYVNEVTHFEEAARFYGIFTLAANMSGIFSGQLANALVLDKPIMALSSFYATPWEQTVFLQTLLVSAVGLFILVLFWYLNRYVIVDTQEQIKHFVQKEKPKISLKASFAYLAKSPYALCIAVMVVAYNIVYNLADVLWANQIQINLQGNSALINRYMNQVTSVTGILATLSALFLSGNVIRRFGWKTTAMITPIIWLVTGLGVFGGFFAESQNPFWAEGLLHGFGFSLPFFILMLGSAQICLGRASKYTVFDESKEMAFIPLAKEEQRKSKAVIDGIGSRFGKAGGSLLIQVLLITCGNLTSAIPWIALIFFVMVLAWIGAVGALAKRLPGVQAKKTGIVTESEEEMPESMPDREATVSST